MQTATTALTNKLQQSYDINSSIRVIAEWNQNRYGAIKSIVNSTLIGSAILTDSTDTITASVAHGLVVYDRVQFGAVIGTTNVVAGTVYYVSSVPTTTTFKIAATFGGATINISVNGTSVSLDKVIEDYDEELFPIDSIVLPDRPTYRGNLKARAGGKTKVAGVGAEGFTNTGYEDTPRGARYGTADVATKYKYWTSPQESTGEYLNTPATITNCAPSVVYTTAHQCNKILVAFESSYAQPSIYYIQVTTDGTTWTTVATTPTIPDSGRVEIYRQANGTWSSTPYYDNPQAILGLKVYVTQMNKSKVFFNLIELSARLEADLSAYVVSLSVNNSMSENSFVTPLGTASANTGSINLSNTDGQFTNDNPGSPYYTLLDKNVEFRISEGTNIGTYSAPDFEWIRIATMRSNDWSGQDLDMTSVSLSDDFVRLQELKPNAIFYQSMTVGEIIWRLMDSVGLVNYKYEARADDPATTIPFFWTDGTKTLAEIFNELSQATQTAIFFDEYNILQIMTRDAAYDMLKVTTPSWTLDAENSGVKLPDIIDLEKTYDFEANVVNTSYVETKMSAVSASGIPTMEIVWEPEGTVALRSVALKSNLTTTSTYGWFDQTYMSSWPFTGIIQIEGEFIRYTHKYYRYYNALGVLAGSWIKSNDEKIKLDKINPTLAYKNFYSGSLYFGLANRGLWSSVPKAHSVDITGWAGRYRTLGGTVHTWNGGMHHDKANSAMRISTNKTFSANSWYCVLTGSTYDTQPKHYGTRLKFPSSGYAHGIAGMVIGATTNDSGYFIEINRTKVVGTRKWSNEICFYVRYSNGSISRIAGKGLAMAVDVNQWIDLDVTISYPGSGAINFNISINGVIKMNVLVPYAKRPSGLYSGRWGMFTRGWTIANFEYAYSSVYGLGDALDDEGYFDRISGGYMSSQLMRQFVYSSYRTSRIIRKKRYYYYRKYAQTTIDEFGPIAHEVREMDVKFSKTPVLNSSLYFSNDTQVICPEYSADSFGAKFIIANTSRTTAMVNGEDTWTFGKDRAINHRGFVSGRTLAVSEAKIETVRNDVGIKKRGEVAVDISSPWIQSKAAAASIGEWITYHWSAGADEVTVSTFGNPLIQLGDVVAVNYPVRDMLAATHKYFVVKVGQEYSTGLSTNLTLRRVTSNSAVVSPPLI